MKAYVPHILDVVEDLREVFMAGLFSGSIQPKYVEYWLKELADDPYSVWDKHASIRNGEFTICRRVAEMEEYKRLQDTNARRKAVRQASRSWASELQEDTTLEDSPKTGKVNRACYSFKEQKFWYRNSERRSWKRHRRTQYRQVTA